MSDMGLTEQILLVGLGGARGVLRAAGGGGGLATAVLGQAPRRDGDLGGRDGPALLRAGAGA